MRLFGRDNLDRHRRDLDRVGKEMPRFEAAPALVLAKITGGTLISGYTTRYTYGWEEAWMQGSSTGTTCVARPNGLSGEAYSVSELSNPATPPGFVSYGVALATLPGTFAPKPIPIGTIVILSAHRRADGDLTWLIINTQAIDGECPEP